MYSRKKKVIRQVLETSYIQHRLPSNFGWKTHYFRVYTRGHKFTLYTYMYTWFIGEKTIFTNIVGQIFQRNINDFFMKYVSFKIFTLYMSVYLPTLSIATISLTFHRIMFDNIILCFFILKCKTRSGATLRRIMLWDIMFVDNDCTVVQISPKFWALNFGLWNLDFGFQT